MHLIQRSLQGRSFLLQFFQIMEEFGDEIPWLQPLKGISYTTNGVYFRDQVIKRLGLKDIEHVTAFQFVTPGREHEYIGGVMRFAAIPEVFRDRDNQDIQARLVCEGYHFISCLQVRERYQGQGHGRLLMKKALNTILGTHGRVWGVVSKPSLISWYQSLGATLHSPHQNDDKLWIISWN